MCKMYNLNYSSDCSAGYSKNDSTGECDDIDECEDGEVTCNIETQVCFNTIGSYKCLDIAPATSCPDGYKQNSITRQCEGKICAPKNSARVNSLAPFHPALYSDNSVS